METVIDGCSFPDFYRVGAGIEICICTSEGIENEFGVFSVGVFGFEGIAFYDEQCFVIEGCYLCGFPNEQVVVDVPVPLCDDFGYAAVHLPIPVDDEYDGIVGFFSSSSDVDNGYVPA